MHSLSADIDKYIGNDIYPNQPALLKYLEKLNFKISNIPVKNLTTRPKRKNRIAKDKFLWDYGCFESSFQFSLFDKKNKNTARLHYNKRQSICSLCA